MNGHRFIYLAHPVDFVGAHAVQVDDLLQEAQRELLLAGVGYYQPAASWGGTGNVPVGREIAKVNTRAQGLCTGTLALLPDNVPTRGVVDEIARATRGWGMPCAVFGRESWAMPDYLSGARWFQTVQQAVGWLLQQPAVFAPKWSEPLPFVVDHDQGGALPSRTYADDAGLDLYVAADRLVEPGSFVDIPCAARVQLPDNSWAMITGRSSTLRKRGLLVAQGIIDTGYRGELFSGVWNLGDSPVLIKAGERIAQMIIINNATEHYAPIEVAQLATHQRGDAGFGSTGN